MKLKFVFSLSFLLLLLSCKKKFLDVDNNSAVFRQSFVKDLKSMGEFVNGIYKSNAESIEVYSINAYPEIVADNLKPADLQNGYLLNHYAWAQKADAKEQGDTPGRSNTMNAMWKVSYRMIRACNFVIEDIDKYRKENPVLSDDMKGQALALRAYVHFKLLAVFAQPYSFSLDGSHPGIPYIITSDISKPYSRASVANVYNAIIEDLKTAISMLPQNPEDPRLMNVLAAKALLARVYLFQGDYLKAKQPAVEITDRVPLLTIQNGYPNDLFKFKKMANTELLFQAAPSAEFPNILGRVLRSPLYFHATADVASILQIDLTDVRRSWTTQSGSNWLVTKFPVGVAPEISIAASAQSAAYYSPVIRSSELFLTVAECAARLNEDAIAREYLNKVRLRANPQARMVEYTGSELLERICEERRKELCFEGLRMGDLQRWKLGVHRSDAPILTAKDLQFGSDRAIAPIPPQDVELMGISQNYGY